MPSSNVHLRVVNDAVRTNRKLASLAGKLGTKKNPNGKVLVIYRQLRRDIKRVLDSDKSNDEKRRETDQILSVGTLALQGIISNTLTAAGDLGVDSASRQLSLYDIEATRFINQFTSVNSGVTAAMGAVTSQFDQVLAQVTISADPAIIIGDAARQGILRPSPIVRNSFDVSAALTGALWIDKILSGLEAQKQKFFKQAIATMDNRVTDTCLRVHGQIQPFDDPYRLVGTPRFADEIDAPPFHNHCRTSSALYLPEFDLGITDLLKESARAVLGQRAAGIEFDISPADAFIPGLRAEAAGL